MSEDDNTSKETRNSFVRSLRRLSSSVFRFLFRRDYRNANDSDKSDAKLPKIFSYPPENSSDAFVVEDFERFQELLRDSSERTDTALNFFADSQKKDELDPSIWTGISEQQINPLDGLVRPPLLSKWNLKSLLFKRRKKSIITEKKDGNSPWLAVCSQ